MLSQRLQKTTIFIYNGTSTNFLLTDNDGNIFGHIEASVKTVDISRLNKYSFQLNYSSTSNKEYNLRSDTCVLNFWLDINGEIVSVNNTPLDYLQIGLGGERQSNYRLQEVQPSLFKRTLQIAHNTS